MNALTEAIQEGGRVAANEEKAHELSDLLLKFKAASL